MKKIIICLFLTGLSLKISSQNIPITVQVDERTELLGIAFRLMGANEYKTDNLPEYADKIDAYFAPYKEHPLILFLLQLRSEYGAGGAGAMSLATHLEIKNGEILLKTPIEHTDRWGSDNIPRFLSLLNQFYRESNFHQFFEQQKEIREIAERNFRKLLEDVDFEWFEKFYGELPTGNFHVIVSLTNGPHNYGPHIDYDGRKDIYAIIGSGAADTLGNPVYSKGITRLVIHEFSHSFCNPLVDEYLTELRPQSDKFYQLIGKKLVEQGYGGTESLIYEILVRACELKYQQSKGFNEWVKYSIASERSLGFIWMENLFEALTSYENNREQYPTLRSFMPEIVKLQNSLNPRKMYKEQMRHTPQITGTNIKNGSIGVDPSIDKIIVKFDKPMFTKANGSSYGKKGKEYFVEVSNAEWNEKSKKDWIMHVKLQPNTEYSLSFPAQFFITEDGYKPEETYYLDFKTKAK